MRFRSAILAAIVLAASLPGPAQSAAGGSGQPPITAPSLTVTLDDAPQPVSSASVAIVGNPGYRSVYYWIVTNTVLGSSTPAGPYLVINAPSTYVTSAAGAVLNWPPVANAVSYDILRTWDARQPSGACNCAVATGLTSTSYTDTVETRLSYTVLPIDPNKYAATLTNKSSGPGASILMFGGTVNTPGGTFGAGTIYSPDTAIDVKAFGAVGDCASDDHNAIQAAMQAAYAALPQRAVFFSRPPGGCYLSSTLTWLGVSLLGVPSGPGDWAGGMTSQLRGKPGQDIFNVPDPDDVVFQVPNKHYTIANLDLVVDDSIDVSAAHPHRKPGRTITDAAMSSGSPLLTSTTQGEFSAGDAGQSVTVSGAGVSGATLTTTIASVQSATLATLSAYASTTVSGATSYISLAGLPATATIGNCAVAWDNRDGNYANWKAGARELRQNGVVWRDVNIRGLSGALLGQNSSCGIFAQPYGGLYAAVFDNVNIQRLQYDFAEVPNDVNPQLGFVGGDFLSFSHGSWFGAYPFIVYNGGQGHIQEVQIASSVGPQLVQAYSSFETYPAAWDVHQPETETNTVMGWRVEGRAHDFNITSLGGGTGVPVWWDASNSTCELCSASGTLNVSGIQNHIVIAENIDSVTVADVGHDNRIEGYRIANTNGATEPVRPQALTIQRGSVAGLHRGDFVNRGLTSASYNNDADLWFWPSDMNFWGTYGTIQTDSTVESGMYIPIYNGGVSGFNAFQGAGSPISNTGALIGKNVPAAKVTMYVKSKCSAVTSYSLSFNAQTAGGGQTQLYSGSPSCSATYSVTPITADLTAYAGHGLEYNISASSGEVDLAWIAVRPWNVDQLVNGTWTQSASGSAYTVTHQNATLTANHTRTEPDADGTYALTSQIPTVPETLLATSGNLTTTASTSFPQTTWSAPSLAWYRITVAGAVTTAGTGSGTFQVQAECASGNATSGTSEALNTAYVGSSASQDCYLNTGMKPYYQVSFTGSATGAVVTYHYIVESIPN